MESKPVSRLAGIVGLALAIVACGREERDATREALAKAYTVRDAVEYTQGRYSVAFQETYPSGWDAVNVFREGPEGQAAKAFLSPYGRPSAVSDGFRRFAEIREVSLVTAELVTLALEPRGTWISFGQEMNSIRTRLDRAILSLETGTKDPVVTEAKAEARRRVGSFTGQLATAVAKADEEKRRADAESRQLRERADKARLDDLLAQEQRQKERLEEWNRQREEQERRAMDATFKRRAAAGPEPTPPKLGGGTFRTAATPAPH